MVSIGPGFQEYVVSRAKEVLKESDIIIGYKTYIDIIKKWLPDKCYVVKGMRQELERCKIAVKEALQRCKVSLVSGGDVGIYGMAGALLEFCRNHKINVFPKANNQNKQNSNTILVEVIPGVSALNAAASILGAPLTHDFATISLSDHLTPWPTIEKRLRMAAAGDFVIVLFNPRSKTRPHLLEKAISIISEYATLNTPVGIVQRAMREGQSRTIVELSNIPFNQIDMQTIIIVGNSNSFVWNDWMITPRGYQAKYMET